MARTMLLTRNRAKAENGGGAESQAVESHGWFRGGEWKVRWKIKKMSLLCVPAAGGFPAFQL